MEIILALIAGTVLAYIIGFTQSYIGKIIKNNESIELEDKKIRDDKYTRARPFIYYVTPEDLEKFKESATSSGYIYTEVKWFECTYTGENIEITNKD